MHDTLRDTTALGANLDQRPLDLRLAGIVRKAGLGALTSGAFPSVPCRTQVAVLLA